MAGPIDSDIPPSFNLKRSGTLILNWHKGWLTILPVTFWDETESRLFRGLLRIRSFLLNLQLFELLHLFHSLSSDGIIGVAICRLRSKSLSLTRVWLIRKMDVKNAFVHGKWNEEVFMAQRPGFDDPHHPRLDMCLSYILRFMDWKKLFRLDLKALAFSSALIAFGFTCCRPVPAGGSFVAPLLRSKQLVSLPGILCTFI